MNTTNPVIAKSCVFKRNDFPKNKAADNLVILTLARLNDKVFTFVTIISLQVRAHSNMTKFSMS